MDMAGAANAAEPANFTGALQSVVESHGMTGVCVSFCLWMLYRLVEHIRNTQNAQLEIYRKDSETQVELVKEFSVMKSDIHDMKSSLMAIHEDNKQVLAAIEKNYAAIEKRSEVIFEHTNVLQMIADKLGGGAVQELPRPHNTTRILRRREEDNAL